MHSFAIASARLVHTDQGGLTQSIVDPVAGAVRPGAEDAREYDRPCPECASTPPGTVPPPFFRGQPIRGRSKVSRPGGGTDSAIQVATAAPVAAAIMMPVVKWPPANQPFVTPGSRSITG
jgi:hypothetical protein